MASVLVYIQTEGVEARQSSIEVLGEARRISTTLGGTLYALVTVASDMEACGPLIEMLGKNGSDRVAVARSDSHTGPSMWASRGSALTAACARIRPNLVLVASDEPGRDIGPRLAAHLHAAFLSEPSVQYGSHGEVVLSRTVYGATYRERISAEDLDIPIVVSLSPGSYRPAQGLDEAEVLFIESDGPAPAIEIVSTSDDPGSALDQARVVVTAGAGCDDKATELVSELAKALGGERAWTLSSSSAPDADATRVVDVGSRSVAPELYIACGAAGSMAHLGAVSPDSEIVAINSDPKAPIFRVASYGIVGDVSEVLPSLIAELRKRS